jgi:hypothetical protein
VEQIKGVEKDLKDMLKKVNELCGIKESDTGLAPPSRWDLVADKQATQEEQPLQVNLFTVSWTPFSTTSFGSTYHSGGFPDYGIEVCPYFVNFPPPGGSLYKDHQPQYG